MASRLQPETAAQLLSLFWDSNTRCVRGYRRPFETTRCEMEGNLQIAAGCRGSQLREVVTNCDRDRSLYVADSETEIVAARAAPGFAARFWGIMQGWIWSKKASQTKGAPPCGPPPSPSSRASSSQPPRPPKVRPH